MIVRELLTRLGFSVNGAQFNKAEQATQRIKRQANEAANAVRGMVAGFIGFQGIKSLIATGDQVQSLQARIGMLPQTVGEASDSFNAMADRAIAARSSLQAYGTLYVRLAGSTKEFLKTQEEVFLVTDAISQALVIGGATANEAASATLQLSQAFQKGKLDGDEFKSFMENLSTDFKDKLAKEIGTTTDKLYDMSSSGQLTTRKLAEAFKRMAPEISKQMQSIPLAVGQAFTMVGARFGKMINRINNETSFIPKIAKIITGAMDSIEIGVESLEKKFGGFNNILRSLGVLIGVIVAGKFLQFIAATKGVSLALAALAGGNVLRALKILRIALIGTFLPMLLMAAGVALVALAVDDFIVYMNGGSSVIGDFVKWINSGIFAADLLKSAMLVLGVIVAGFAVVKIGIMIKALALMAGKFALTAGAALWAGAKIAAGFMIAFWPIGLIVVALIGLVAAFFYVSRNWEKITGIFQSLMQRSAQAILGFWQPVRDWFADFFGWFGDKYEAIKGFVAPALGGSASMGGVTPGSLSPNAMGQSKSIQNNTSVTVTVPPGTTAEQASFLQAAAAKSFGDASDAKFARQISVYAP